MTKKYNEEFKKEVVKEYLKGRTTGEIAKEYGIAKSSVSAWSKIYNEECLYKTPNLSTGISNNEEIRTLNKRITELEKENNFLKKAAAFFAKEID